MAFYITAPFPESGQVNVEGIANATPQSEQFVHYRDKGKRVLAGEKPSYGS